MHKTKKAQKKKSDQNLSYDQIDWRSHVQKNTLKSLKVATLNKYLLANKLQQHLNLKKKDKLLIIQNSVNFASVTELLKNRMDQNPGDVEVATHEDEDDDDDDDGNGKSDGANEDDPDEEVITLVGLDEHDEEDEEIEQGVLDEISVSNHLSSDSESENDVEDVFVSTRYGRSTTSWKASYYK